MYRAYRRQDLDELIDGMPPDARFKPVPSARRGMTCASSTSMAAPVGLVMKRAQLTWVEDAVLALMLWVSLLGQLIGRRRA